MATIERERQQLRTVLKAQRRALNDAELELAAQRLQTLVVGAMQRPQFYPLLSAKHVAGYLSANGEISVEPLLASLRNLLIRTYTPVVSGQTLDFAPLNETTELRYGRFGIRVPHYKPSELKAPSAMQVVLVPLVAFDANGNRLGMGGGFYDRSFAHLLDGQRTADRTGTLIKGSAPRSQFLIGVAHHFQQRDQLPAASWDVPLDAIVTDQQIILPGAQ